MTAAPILALDATGGACSAAVWADGGLRSHRLETMARGQAERLVPMIDQVMTDAGIGFAELALIAVTVGPGSFTGVRIGLATARALALACGCPLLGATTFETVAAALGPEQRAGRTLVVLIESKRAELYVQVFGDSAAEAGPPCCLAPAQLDRALPAGPLLLAGDGAARALAGLVESGRQDLVVGSASGPLDAAWLAELAAGRPLPSPDAPPPGPLYLRAPDVTLPAGSPKT